MGGIKYHCCDMPEFRAYEGETTWLPESDETTLAISCSYNYDGLARTQDEAREAMDKYQLHLSCSFF